MRSIVFVTVLLLATRIFSAGVIRPSTRVDSKMTKTDAKEILTEFCEDVKKEIQLKPNQLFIEIKDLITDIPEKDFAVLINGSNEEVTFEACPNSIANLILGCKKYITQPGKPNYIVKPRTILSDQQILLKINGKAVQVLYEGLFYTFAEGGFEAKGRVSDWKEMYGIADKFKFEQLTQ